MAWCRSEDEQFEDGWEEYIRRHPGAKMEDVDPQHIANLGGEMEDARVAHAVAHGMRVDDQLAGLKELIDGLRNLHWLPALLRGRPDEYVHARMDEALRLRDTLELMHQIVLWGDDASTAPLWRQGFTIDGEEVV